MELNGTNRWEMESGVSRWRGSFRRVKTTLSRVRELIGEMVCGYGRFCDVKAYGTGAWTIVVILSQQPIRQLAAAELVVFKIHCVRISVSNCKIFSGHC